jgi:DNA-binding LacI/PurR family transcriptional regulator
MIQPVLTTYCQDSEMIGRLAASKLISQIENPKLFVPELVKVKGKLQEGGTIRPLVRPIE